MKLIDYLISRITLFFTVIMLLWATVYFFLQMKEIHDGIDEGLTNLKQEFIAKANTTSGFTEILKDNTPPNFYIKEIMQEDAETLIENFTTTAIYFPTELEKEEVRMLTTAFRCEQNGKYYQLQFFISTVESNDLTENMLYLLLGLWITLSLTMFVVGKIIITKANKPFYRLLDELKRFNLDNSRMIDFPPVKIREYIQLNNTVRELLEKNMHVFTEQKVFIENTSHELQTPLAIAIAKLENLLEKYRNDETYVKELAGVLDILNRMKRLNSNLLLLSKIKNRQFAESRTVNLRETLEKVIVEFDDLAAYRQITVEQKGNASLVLQINEDLVHILFTNLVKNAIIHNEPNGKISIRYASDTITIANTGNRAAAKMFDRYQTGASDEKSSGLGLSIVKTIADLYQIEINYCYDGEMHIFKLSINSSTNKC
ncbi:MAG: HAMP domain-containing histidine kinase [Prevotellaceae bacterium]|jgi:signal transduction histidine kinase|nr:HAMP domain-containing histidine kinase [Prevotellaceae bacterium]